jgi:hypothetical protein
MHEHGPNCLEGPIRGSFAWWRGLVAAREEVGYSNRATRTKPEEVAIRQELVQRVRREIQAGTYDTPEKWQAALDRLLERLDRD